MGRATEKQMYQISCKLRLEKFVTDRHVWFQLPKRNYILTGCAIVEIHITPDFLYCGCLTRYATLTRSWNNKYVLLIWDFFLVLYILVHNTTLNGKLYWYLNYIPMFCLLFVFRRRKVYTIASFTVLKTYPHNILKIWYYWYISDQRGVGRWLYNY